MRQILYIFSVIFVIATRIFAQEPLPPFTADDRIVVVAPHPDDEILGAGGVMQQAVEAGARVHVIYLTCGDHNQVAFKLYRRKPYLTPRDYIALGKKRQLEARNATSHLGVPPENLVFLGYPDWGTLHLWQNFWDGHRPFRSDSTRATAVPYENAFRFRNPYVAPSVVSDLGALFSEIQPTKIFVTHPADTNPDHRAAANFVRLAALKTWGEGERPTIYYYLVHFGRWPRRYHYHPEEEFEPPRALLDVGDWKSQPLLPQQVQKKHDSILMNRTQLTTRQYFLVSFARANEIFAVLPVQRIPHLPSTAPLNWRNAARHKAIEFTPNEFEREIPDDETAPYTETRSLMLSETALLRHGDDLVVQILLRNRLIPRTNIHLFLFGYKNDMDFAQLPKLRLTITPLGSVRVYDGATRVSASSVSVDRVGHRFFVRVPLRLLTEDGAPDHLFTATRANLAKISPDDSAWRLFSLSENAKSAHKTVAAETK
jgi:LmbE family N-acetylglucosaminyl deacetylase